MAADALVAPSTRARRGWLTATLVVTLGPLAALPFVAPDTGAPPAAALGWLLFAGTSMHVGSTAWFYTVREVREHMAAHPARFHAAPALLIVAAAAAATLLPTGAMVPVLLAFFAWQFWHFQKQNLGVAALAARAHGVPAMSRAERTALVAAGIGGTVGLLGHPQLLSVAGAPRLDAIFWAGGVVFAAAAVAGLVLLARRVPADRRPAYAITYATSLLFFAPVWCFASPYAAVAGLTVAHGLQYLLLMGLVAAGAGQPRQAVVGTVVLIDVALLLGLVLAHLSHLHGTTGAGPALYGAFLGLNAAHFVVDAGLWRLRDSFPREFLARRLPYLLAPGRS